MDMLEQQILNGQGMVVKDSTGREALRVYLQYLPEVPGRSRRERTKTLRKQFEKVAQKYADSGVELDPDSMSVTGQLIEALVPVDHYEHAIHALERDDLRVDLVQGYQATL